MIVTRACVYVCCVWLRNGQHGMQKQAVLDKNSISKRHFISLTRQMIRCGFEFVAKCFSFDFAPTSDMFFSFHFIVVAINIIICFETILKRKYQLHNGKSFIMKIKWILFDITRPKSHDYVCMLCVYLICDVGIYCCHRRLYIYFEIINTSTHFLSMVKMIN